ncbi:MAG: alpha/beta fold hydrolase [Bradymonadaceae bacterium]
MPTYTTDDGIDLYYEYDAPSDEGPTVVFLNGMTQSTKHWERQMRLFGDDYGVVTYDGRGQGQTPLGDGEVTMDRRVADLADLLDHLAIDEPHVCGFSHGARIALGFAADRPDRTDRLVLCSATADPTARARTIVRSWRETLRHGGLEAMSWAAVPAILGNDYLEQNESILEGIVRAAIRRNSEQGVAALLDAMEQYPELGDLADEVVSPTLVLSASEDPLVEADGARLLADRAGGDHDQITGVGHTIPIEAPEAFHRRVADFLGHD